jgi:hypothetical protein
VKKTKSLSERYSLEASRDYLSLVYRELMKANEPSLALRVKAIKSEVETTADNARAVRIVASE